MSNQPSACTTASVEAAFRAYQSHGDVRALAHVFDQLAAELILVANHFAGDAGEAEDLVQATFLAAIEYADRYDPKRPLRPWLVGILAHLAQRERGRRRKQPDPARLLRREELDPCDAAHAADVAATIARAMAGLPHPYREALTLHWVHGLTAGQIGRALGRPPGTVKTQLRRGLDILRRTLPASLIAGLVAWLSAGRALAMVRAAVLAAAGGPLESTTVAAAVPRLTRSWRVVGFAAGVVVMAVVALGFAGLGAESTVKDAKAAPSPSASSALQRRDHLDAGDRTAAALPQEATVRVPLGGLRVHVLWSDGSPAAGVQVCLVPWLHESPALHARWLAADAEGTANVASWPDGPVQVTTDRGGGATAAVRHDQQNVITLSIPRGVDVVGRVVGRDGALIPDAEVFLTTREVLDLGRVVARTDATGSFAVRSVEPGRCLSALAARYAPSGLTPVWGGTAEPVYLELRCQRPARRLSGTVRDPDGRPVPSAWVLLGERFRSSAQQDARHLVGRSPPISLETDAEGEFSSASVPLGPTPLWVRTPGWAPFAGHIPSDECGHYDIDLERGVTLEGRVWQPDGRVAAAAQVSVHDGYYERRDASVLVPDWFRSSVVTDARGMFRITGLPRMTLRAVARSTGELTEGLIARQTFDPGQAGVLRWDAELRLPSKLSGVVRDEHGQPRPDLMIELEAPSPWTQPEPAFTDADGRFSLTGLDDCGYRLACRPRNSAWPGAALARHPVYASADPILLTASTARLSTASLVGQFVDALPGSDPLRLELADWHQAVRMEFDAVSGQFELGPLPPQTYFLFAYRDQALAAVLGPFELHAQQRLDCGRALVERPGTVKILVQDDKGQPNAERCEVTLCNRQGRNLYRLKFRAGGRLPMPPGEFFAHIYDQVSPTGRTAFAVQSDVETTLVLTRSQGVPCQVTLPPPADGNDLRVDVVWEDRDGRLLIRHQDHWFRDGNTEFDFVSRLAPGEYRLRVVSRDGRSGEAEVRVTAEPTTGQRLSLDLR